MITMTWPQYLRRECCAEDWVVKLSPMQTELLFMLLVRYPFTVEIADLIEAAYPDADDEPECARSAVHSHMRQLARKLGAFRFETRPNLGYRLLQYPADLKRAA